MTSIPNHIKLYTDTGIPDLYPISFVMHDMNIQEVVIDAGFEHSALINKLFSDLNDCYYQCANCACIHREIA